MPSGLSPSAKRPRSRSVSSSGKRLRLDPPTEFEAIKSPTLTHSQAQRASFIIPRSLKFRVGSTPTLAGHSTGYHEAIVTTDTFHFLGQARDNGNGTHTLVQANGRSFFRVYKGKVVDSSILQHVMDLADGFRTDTSRTVLSAPQSRVAGHSGSGLNLTNQSDAHDLLRKEVMNLLEQHPSTPGFTKKSIACIFGSVVSISIAPGELARTITGGTRSLKDASFKSDYEQAREEVKARVRYFYKQLSPAEQSFVNEHAESFISSTINRGRGTQRQISLSRPTSPRRDTSNVSANEVSGRGYLPIDFDLQPSATPPSNINQIGIYFTEPFRALRR